MWMLVRADALGNQEQDGRRKTLAACPDSADRGDPWRWTVSLKDDDVPVLETEYDGDYIAMSRHEFSEGATATLVREQGTQLVIVALDGEALVAATDGPWERWLRRGDVFIVEGEDREAVRLSLAGGNSRVEVVSVAPKRAHALRWVP